DVVRPRLGEHDAVITELVGERRERHELLAPVLQWHHGSGQGARHVRRSPARGGSWWPRDPAAPSSAWDRPGGRPTRRAETRLARTRRADRPQPALPRPGP